MDSESLMIVAFVLITIVAIRLLAGMNNFIGRIFRFFWNLGFTIAAFIPFMGWMAKLIIADTANEKAAKEDLVRTGEKTDDDAYDYVGKKSAAKLQRLEELERLNTSVPNTTAM